MKFRRLPNNYGSIVKLSGNRRRPYAVKKRVGIKPNGSPQYKIIGYTETYEQAMIMLAQYNSAPWNLDRTKATVKDIYKLWEETRANKLGENRRSTLKSAYKYIKTLEHTIYASLRAYHMRSTIDMCDKGYATKNNIKSLWGHLDDTAIEHEIITVKYSDNLEAQASPPSIRQPFTTEQIKKIWEHADEPWYDVILIYIYSGWRFNELLQMKKSDVDLEQRIMRGGSKTKNGINRIVPIHSRIYPLIERRMKDAAEYLISHKGRKVSASNFRIHWNNIMANISPGKVPHECRHTFRTLLDNAGANQKCMDLLMGHSSGSTGERIYTHKTLEQLRETIELITI